MIGKTLALALVVLAPSAEANDNKLISAAKKEARECIQNADEANWNINAYVFTDGSGQTDTTTLPYQGTYSYQGQEYPFTMTALMVFEASETGTSQQDFDFGLSPYYRLRWQDQSITPRDAVGALAEDIEAHTGGVEYEKGPIRLTAEYEDYDSNISPFRATRLGADLTKRLESGASATIKTRWSRVIQQALRQCRR